MSQRAALVASGIVLALTAFGGIALTGSWLAALSIVAGHFLASFLTTGFFMALVGFDTPKYEARFEQNRRGRVLVLMAATATTPLCTWCLSQTHYAGTLAIYTAILGLIASCLVLLKPSKVEAA